MDQWNLFIKKIIDALGFADYTVDLNEEHRHGTVFIHDSPALVKEHLPALVESVNYLAQLVARKNGEQPVFFDINNYRRERENLIVELVRASARKALVTKQEVPLPAMNSYERRLAHVELAANPFVMTESVGMGRGRYVVIKPIDAVASAVAGVSPLAERRDESEVHLPIESA